MNMIANHALRIAALICAAALALSAEAQEADTLKRVKSTNSITIGHRDASIPFSYLDEKQQPIGYSVDICLRIVDAIKAS